MGGVGSGNRYTRDNPPPDELRCTAKSQSTRERCCRLRTKSQQLCPFHLKQRARKSGARSVNFKNGVGHGRKTKYGAYLESAEDTAKRYLESLDDEKLYDLRDDVALVDARIKQILSGMEEDAPAHMWNAFAKHWFTELREALEGEDEEKKTKALETIDQIFKNKLNNEAAWKALQNQQEHKADLLDKIRRYEIDAAKVLRMEQAELMFAITIATIGSRVKEHIGQVAVGVARAFLADLARDFKMLQSGRNPLSVNSPGMEGFAIEAESETIKDEPKSKRRKKRATKRKRSS